MLPEDPAAWKGLFRSAAPESVIRPLAASFGGVSGVRAALIHGSLGRGEFTCLHDRPKPFPLSDVEAVIVVEAGRRGSRARDLIRARVRDVGIWGGGSNPFFTLDYSVVTAAGLRLLPKWFITFEKRHGSMVVGEAAVRERIPQVTPLNIDLRETNETIVWRLLHLLVSVPAAVIEGGSLAADRARVWTYLCFRNLLDITTWIAPHLGVLRVGFRDRVRSLAAHPVWPSVEQWLGEDLGEVLQEALDWKAHPRSVATCPDPYARCLELFESAFELIVSPKRHDPPFYPRRTSPAQPFLGLSNPRRLWTVARSMPWRMTGIDGGDARRWTMEDLGKSILALHHAGRRQRPSPGQWTGAVERLLRELQGFLPGIDERIDRYRNLQTWWRCSGD